MPTFYFWYIWSSNQETMDRVFSYLSFSRIETRQILAWYHHSDIRHNGTFIVSIYQLDTYISHCTFKWQPQWFNAAWYCMNTTIDMARAGCSVDWLVSPLTHWGRGKMPANSQTTLPSAFSLKFIPKGLINNIPALVQMMTWRRSGDRPLSEPMMVKLPTHIWVTWPQWVTYFRAVGRDWSTLDHM